MATSNSTLPPQDHTGLQSHNISQSPSLTAAQSLQQTFQSAQLHILEARSQLESKKFEELDEFNHSGNKKPGGGTFKDPAIVAADVAAHMSYLNKLKFQYLEQFAKDKYVKTIVSDDPQPITTDQTEELRVVNEKKKEALKSAKVKLNEKYGDIRGLAPFVEQDYQKAQALTSQAHTLSQRILDARLSLSRLRASHPPTARLTIPAAESQLDEQTAQMAILDEELQEVNRKVEAVKERVREEGRRSDQLKGERAEVERAVKEQGGGVEDDRVVGLYDWYTASLALRQSLLSLETHHSVSENELHLTYSIPPPSTSPPNTEPRRIKLTLLFVPNTRQLANAVVEGDGLEDVGDVIDVHIGANDVPGLIGAVLARARAGWRDELNS
ncbi:hypothetical protein JAAARDRAFT_172079 [Jaapia argillacea MUCL 33604]|uniref:Kinetochore protein Sos7 coiled-coil domain-containing protein n=1 Tax=Jaapia argillacea MUCL 33604 TaxID=933084 RepID=A0A067Q3R2_9AGAM|nr:hypothetical protein JAAARDRAFT_172079 [Jaapia argillacea MUCL 33604]